MIPLLSLILVEGEKRPSAPLGRLAFPNAADVDHTLAHGLEQRLQKLDRFGGATDYEDELSIFSSDLRTGHGRIHPLHPFGGNAFGKFGGS